MWCRVPRVAYCLLFFSISYTQTWSSRFKLALSCCTPATALFRLLWQGKNFRPFWHNLPPFLYTLNPSCSPSLGTDRESFGNISKRKNILSVKGQSEIGIILENITLNDWKISVITAEGIWEQKNELLCRQYCQCYLKYIKVRKWHCLTKILAAHLPPQEKCRRSYTPLWCLVTSKPQPTHGMGNSWATQLQGFCGSGEKCSDETWFNCTLFACGRNNRNPAEAHRSGEGEQGDPARQPQGKAERSFLVCESLGSIHLMLLETQSIQGNGTL